MTSTRDRKRRGSSKKCCCTTSARDTSIRSNSAGTKRGSDGSVVARRLLGPENKDEKEAVSSRLLVSLKGFKKGVCIADLAAVSADLVAGAGVFAATGASTVAATVDDGVVARACTAGTSADDFFMNEANFDTEGEAGVCAGGGGVGAGAADACGAEDGIGAIGAAVLAVTTGVVYADAGAFDCVEEVVPAVPRAPVAD